jgi:large subunit ribosomal protein L29e
MAKSKNHTNHNNTPKWHKNGIHAPKAWHLVKSQRGSWLPALINTRKVRKCNELKAIETRKTKLAKVQAAFGKK